MELKSSKLISTILQWILNTALLLLGILLVFFLARETYSLIGILFSGNEGKTTYLMLDTIVTYFLYFEFIALIVKYFSSGYHFPLRYFIYIGITALIRLIIVDHSNATSTLLHAIAILVLVLALFLANTDKLKRE